MRWKKALGKNVINTQTAETAGKVDGLVADPGSSTIVAMVVDGKILPWTDANGMGADAVTIKGTSGVREPGNELEQRAIDGAGDPLGKTIITEDGFEMGSVNDIDFDPETGTINRLVLSDDDISGSRLMGVGSYAVVISSSTQASSSGNLESLSKAELYERAKERDLDGRSSMSKQELIAALS